MKNVYRFISNYEITVRVQNDLPCENPLTVQPFLAFGLCFLPSTLNDIKVQGCGLLEEHAGKNRGYGLQVRDEKKQNRCRYTGWHNTQEKERRGKTTRIGDCARSQEIRRAQVFEVVWTS